MRSRRLSWCSPAVPPRSDGEIRWGAGYSGSPLASRPGRKAPHLPDVRGEQSWPELYEEVERLPESYRAPVVLCYLEGRTYAEAAGQLCWPIGTLKVRLLRARRLLRSRLSRRGVTLSAGALTASLSSGTSAASVPSSLVESTARLALQFAADPAAVPSASTTVAALSKEVLRIMLMSKLKLTLVIVLAGIVASPGLTLAARQLADAGGGAAQPTPALHVVEPPRDEPAEKGNAQVAEDVKEKNKAVLVALSKQTPQDLPAESTLEALLKQLRVSTQGPGIPNGVPIYVDPSGLQEAVATLDASLKIVRKDTGIGTMLRLSLEPLGLVYAVKDGLVVISSADDLEPRMIGSDPRSLAIVDKLKEDIEIRLPTKPRLDDLLRQIRKVTQGAGENGIPIYVDPDGLTEAGVSLDSAIPDNAQGKGPIKLLLRRSLKPLGLSYAVKDGLLMISSPGGIEQYRRDEGR
jgi:hypothetical protein